VPILKRYQRRVADMLLRFVDGLRPLRDGETYRVCTWCKSGKHRSVAIAMLLAWVAKRTGSERKIRHVMRSLVSHGIV
jgi:RNase adaptor protein for sRNA GlmZ degradation